MLDFTVPAASVEFAGYAAQARIVHVIGTTGCTAEDDAKIAAAARHATIVKSGNMSLGVNLLAVLVEQAAKALGPRISTSRSWRCTTATRSMHRRAPRFCSARPPRAAAPSGSPRTACACATATPARASRHDRLRHAARRLGRRRPFRHPRRHRRAHHAVPPRRGPRDLRARRGQGGALGARQEGRALFDARRSRAWSAHDRVLDRRRRRQARRDRRQRTASPCSRMAGTRPSSASSRAIGSPIIRRAKA